MKNKKIGYLGISTAILGTAAVALGVSAAVIQQQDKRKWEDGVASLKIQITELKAKQKTFDEEYLKSHDSLEKSIQSYTSSSTAIKEQLNSILENVDNRYAIFNSLITNTINDYERLLKTQDKYSYKTNAWNKKTPQHKQLEQLSVWPTEEKINSATTDQAIEDLARQMKNIYKMNDFNFDKYVKSSDISLIILEGFIRNYYLGNFFMSLANKEELKEIPNYSTIESKANAVRTIFDETNANRNFSDLTNKASKDKPSFDISKMKMDLIQFQNKVYELGDNGTFIQKAIIEAIKFINSSANERGKEVNDKDKVFKWFAANTSNTAITSTQKMLNTSIQSIKNASITDEDITNILNQFVQNWTNGEENRTGKDLLENSKKIFESLTTSLQTMFSSFERLNSSSRTLGELLYKDIQSIKTNINIINEVLLNVKTSKINAAITKEPNFLVDNHEWFGKTVKNVTEMKNILNSSAFKINEKSPLATILNAANEIASESSKTSITSLYNEFISNIKEEFKDLYATYTEKWANGTGSGWVNGEQWGENPDEKPVAFMDTKEIKALSSDIVNPADVINTNIEAIAKIAGNSEEEERSTLEEISKSINTYVNTITKMNELYPKYKEYYITQFGAFLNKAKAIYDNAVQSASIKSFEQYNVKVALSNLWQRVFESFRNTGNISLDSLSWDSELQNKKISYLEFVKKYIDEISKSLNSIATARAINFDTDEAFLAKDSVKKLIDTTNEELFKKSKVSETINSFAKVTDFEIPAMDSITGLSKVFDKLAKYVSRLYDIVQNKYTYSKNVAGAPVSIANGGEYKRWALPKPAEGEKFILNYNKKLIALNKRTFLDKVQAKKYETQTNEEKQKIIEEFGFLDEVDSNGKSLFDIFYNLIKDENKFSKYNQEIILNKLDKANNEDLANDFEQLIPLTNQVYASMHDMFLFIQYMNHARYDRQNYALSKEVFNLGNGPSIGKPWPMNWYPDQKGPGGTPVTYWLKYGIPYKFNFNGQVADWQPSVNFSIFEKDKASVEWLRYEKILNSLYLDNNSRHIGNNVGKIQATGVDLTKYKYKFDFDHFKEKNPSLFFGFDQYSRLTYWTPTQYFDVEHDFQVLELDSENKVNRKITFKSTFLDMVADFSSDVKDKIAADAYSLFTYLVTHTYNFINEERINVSIAQDFRSFLNNDNLTINWKGRAWMNEDNEQKEDGDTIVKKVDVLGRPKWHLEDDSPYCYRFELPLRAIIKSNYIDGKPNDVFDLTATSIFEIEGLGLSLLLYHSYPLKQTPFKLDNPFNNNELYEYPYYNSKKRGNYVINYKYVDPTGLKDK